jgi:DNA replication protein DnaC
MAACARGHRLRFHRVTELVTLLMEAREERTLLGLRARLAKLGAELLFDVISSAFEQSSLIVSTNLPFESWTEVLGSERLTGATLDRLTHRCQIIETKGESYRLRDATAKLRKGSAGSAGSKGPRRKALEGGQTSS